MALFGACVPSLPNRSVYTHTISCPAASHFPSVRFRVPSVCSRMADQWLSAHAEWSTWWDHSWQSSTPRFSAHPCDHQSQSRDWTASSSQPRSHWHRPQHQHRLQRPPHSCRSDLMSLRTRLACLWTPPRRQFSPAPLCLKTLPLWLPHTVPPPKTPPHNSRFPIFSRDASPKTFHAARSLLIHEDVSGARGSSNISSHSSTTPVSQAQRDWTPLPPPGLEVQTLLRISHNIPCKAAPVRLPSSCGPCPSSPGTQPASQLPPALQPHVSTTHVGPHPTLSTAAQKEVLVPPLREPALPSVRRPVLAVDHSLSPRPHRTHGMCWATQTASAWLPPRCRQ